MADRTKTTDGPRLDERLDEAEGREAQARSEREAEVREHNRRVLGEHRLNAALQAELADRAVAAVPVAVEAGASWWSRCGHLVATGFCLGLGLYGMEWASHKVRQTLRGRR